MEIANSATRTKYPLSTKKVIKKTFAQMLVLLVLFVVIYAFLSFTIISALPQQFNFYWFLLTVCLTALFGLVFLVVYLYQRWYYAIYYYEFANDFIVIRKGPITPREITVPYERIQDVYVDQDFLDRLFGLYDVHLSSATASSGAMAHIDGVEKAAADGLRADLLDIVSKRISRYKAHHSGTVSASQ